MKIIFVSYTYWPPYFGGELLISIERFESLIERGHQIAVLTSGSPDMVNHEFSNEIEIFRSPKVHKSRLGRIIRRLLFPTWVVLKLIKMKFDLLHLAGTGGLEPITSSLGSIMVCSFAKIKGSKLVSVHSLADSEIEMYSEKGFSNKLRKLNLKNLDAIVSVSPALHNEIKIIFPKKAKRILNAVRNDIFSPLSDEMQLSVRNGFLRKPEDIIFCFMGTVGKRKGFDVLAQAFSELSLLNKNWYLWVIGPRTLSDNQNIDLAEVNKVCSLLENIPERIHFFGRINNRIDIGKILSASDVFVLPTLREGMPLAPMEAMAAGTPIIISRISGVTDIVNIENETGLFVVPGDVNSLKGAMLKLANHSELRMKMGESATNRISDSFSWNQHVTNWENLYSNLSRMN